MNKMQRVVVFVAVFFFVFAAVYPPFIVKTQQGHQMRNWYLLFSGPPERYDAVDMDWGTLLFEWCVVFMAACPLIWVLGGRAQSTGERTTPSP